MQGQAARELLVAVGKLRFFNAAGRVFFFQHVLQARRARLVADAGEGFDVFCLGKAGLQAGGFVTALLEVEDGVLCFAKGAVKRLAIAGEALLVAGFGFFGGECLFVGVQEGQGDVGGECADGVVQQLQQAVGAGAKARAEAEVGVVVAFGDLDVADVLLQAVLRGAQVGALREQMRRDAAVDGGDGEGFQAGRAADDAADGRAEQAGEGGFGLLSLVLQLVAAGWRCPRVLWCG